MVADKARGGLRWTFDLAGAQQMYNSYKELQYWDDMGSVPPGVTVNVVRAENSDRWAPRHMCAWHVSTEGHDHSCSIQLMY